MGELVQLTSFGLTEGEVLGALGRVKVRDVDYADLYFESCVSESVSMEESLVKRAAKSVSQGVGVRATAGEKTGFAYSDELTKKDLDDLSFALRLNVDYIALSFVRAAADVRDLQSIIEAKVLRVAVTRFDLPGFHAQRSDGTLVGAEIELAQQIAQALVISSFTVQAHTRSIYRKLDVSDRREATSKACTIGLIQHASAAT